MRYLFYSFLVTAAVLVSGCSTIFKPAVFSADDCQVLAEKRTVKKIRKQPKVKSYPHAAPNLVSLAMSTVTADSPENIINKSFPETEPVFYASNEPILILKEDELSTKKTPVYSAKLTETISDETFPPVSPPSITGIQSTGILPMAGIFGGTALTSLFLLTLFKRSTLRLSTWAARSPVATRYLFAGIHLATVTGAYTAGSIVFNDGYSLPGSFLAGALVTTAVAGLAYPGMRSSHTMSTWFKRKSYDALLYTAGTAMVFYLGNQQPQVSIRSFEPVSYSMLVHKQSVEEVIEKKTTRADTDQSIHKVPKKRNVGLKILAVVVFLALTFVVMAISCNIACSGSEALALLVFVGLETLLVGLLIRVFKRLSGQTKKKKPETVTGDYKYPAAL